MREKKYYVWFDSLDRGTMINCLNEMRNRLISEGRYTDGVDDLLLKLIDAPTKKIKVIYKVLMLKLNCTKLLIF